MNPTITKIDDNRVQVSNNIQTVQSVTYQYEELLANKARLLEQKQSFEDKIRDIDVILAQCLALGIKEKPIAPVITESAANPVKINS